MPNTNRSIAEGVSQCNGARRRRSSVAKYSCRLQIERITKGFKIQPTKIVDAEKLAVHWVGRIDTALFQIVHQPGFGVPTDEDHCDGSFCKR